MSGLLDRGVEVGTRVLHCQTLVEGRSLARQLRGARMSPPEVTRLATELLEVLDYLHERDVIHRDVKPDNVVIAADGSAHLVDFGAARRLHAAETLEPEPTVVGTPGYMAPEQTRGEAIAQSDLYALGRLLGDALAGAQAERSLAALLPLLTKEDWHKRPASAAAALKMLRPGARQSHRAAWAIIAGVSIATATIVTALHTHTKRAAATQAPAAVEPEQPSGPSLNEQAYALLEEWTAAQNAGDMERYSRCYAPAFSGVRRTPAGTVLKLDRDAWMKDRARILSQRVTVETADVTTAVQDNGAVVISLLQRFRELGNAVLLGTASFWEGVDVRGHALALVVIDKLPFAAPDDPLLKARLEGIRRRGGNPFQEFQLPQAVLALKQGFGRLIRDREDFGVVMLCDPRLRTRGYGRLFMSSLPPATVTTDVEEAASFLRQRLARAGVVVPAALEA